MSKLYCAYDRNKDVQERAIADHRCDLCGKLLCKICGYNRNGIDYCNECWATKVCFTKEDIKDIKVIFK